jgi:hypothetical protein
MHISKINIFLCLSMIPMIMAADRGVEVRPGNNELIETEPKKTVTTVFHVTSKSPGMREFVSNAILPEGWKLITQDFPFQLAENQSEIKLLSFFVPQTAAAGVYEISYQVQDREFPSRLDYYNINVHVLAYRKLEMKLLEVPKSVIAGETYRIGLLLSNESNIADSVRITAASLENSIVAMETARVFLAKGESKTVHLSVRTDPKISKIFKDKIQIQARFSSDKEDVLSQLSVLDVIPKVTGSEDRHHRIPVELGLSQVFEKGRSVESGFQGELSGEGSLGENSDHKIAFKMRGPDIYQTSIYGQHDEYVAGYISKNMDLSVGDRPFSLSPLTEQHRYGRGIEAQMRIPRVETGGYVFKTRWYNPAEQEGAGYVRYKTGEKTEVSMQFMHKDVVERGGDVISAGARWRPDMNNDLELEVALGKKEGAGQKGFYAKGTGQSRRLYYYMNMIYTDPDFPGYYKDTRLASGGVTLSLKENIRINAVYRTERQKYTVDTMMYVAPLSQYAQLGFYYRFADGTSVNLDAVRQSREDRYPVPRFNYDDQYLRIGFTKAFAKISLNGAADLGRSDNHLTNKTSNSRRFNAGVHFHPTPSQAYQSYIQYDDNERYGLGRTNRLTLGFNAMMNLGDGTRFTLNFQNNHSLESYYFDRDMFEMGLTQKLFADQTLSVRARHTLLRNSLERKETAVMVDYRIRWGIPVGAKKSTGVVTGRLFDQETQLPLRDVVVRINGSSAVTDAYGNFMFPSLKPGTYYLHLDKEKIGLNRTTVKPTPMEMVVLGGERQSVDLGVIRSAAYSGRIILCKPPTDSSASQTTTAILRENGEYAIIGDGMNGNSPEGGLEEDCVGLANILIEITKGGETLRRLTDSKGRFQFDEVRPGSWDVKLYPYNLPEYHAFDKDAFTAELFSSVSCPPSDFRVAYSYASVENCNRMR